MRFIRYQVGSEAPQWGWVLDDKVGPLEGVPFGAYRRLDAETPLTAVRLLAPVIPSKVILVGRNYADHAKQMGVEVPDIPLLHLKPPSSIIGLDENIILPPQSQQVEQEAELVVVIGKTGRWIQPEDAMKYIFGYTIGNDVTARDLQRRDGQWMRSKGFDTFCPLGPWIETDLDPSDVLISCRVDGELRQMASTREMVFTAQQLVAFASSVMTLNPGDILFTGTPAGNAPLEAGMKIEISIEGIGTLRNRVIRSPM